MGGGREERSERRRKQWVGEIENRQLWKDENILYDCIAIYRVWDRERDREREREQNYIRK